MPDGQGDVYRLRDLMQRHCFQYGEFKLSAGGTSKYYYNGKLVTLHPPTARLIGEVLVDVIIASGAEAVGGPAIGAIPIASAVGAASLSRDRVLPVFVIRMEQKKYGSRDLVAESYASDGLNLIGSGRRVALVEDTITTGRSLQKAIDAVEGLDAVITTIVVLVERHEGGGDSLRQRDYDVISLFRADEEGTLSVNEEFLHRLEEAQVVGS